MVTSRVIPSAIGRLDDDRLAVAGGRQVDVGREDLDLGEGRLLGRGREPRERRQSAASAATSLPGESGSVIGHRLGPSKGS